MSNNLYEISEEYPQKAAEPISDYGYTIPVTIPTMGGYSVERLKQKLTDFALQLTSVGTKSDEKHYSDRLMKLRSMSHSKFSAEEISSDDRLSYLLNK